MNNILAQFGINTSMRLNDLEWRAQDSNENTVLFYQYHQSDKSYEEFIQRINESKYGILITSGLEKDPKLKNHYNLTTGDFVELQIKLCQEYYPYKKSLNFIGITGTNGKTTTVHIISELLKKKKISHITIGTLGILKNGVEVENFSMTTPPLIDLYKVLHNYSEDIDFVVMELSSHSLVQRRAGGILFDSIGWTSFSQDHLDYHKDIESYFKAKLEILNISKRKLNLSAKFKDLINKIPDCKISDIKIHRNPFLKVRYNQINLDVALGCLSDFSIEVSRKDLDSIKAPPGRFNIIENKSQNIIIDYAHTPDAIENICKESKKSFNSNIVTVFGCGGDRDKSKRPKMLKAALKFSDQVILTSDNPRFENPENIISDVLIGNKDERVKVIVDRAEAIEYALLQYTNAVILILGKGNENYIDVMGVKKPYLDEDVVREIVK